MLDELLKNKQCFKLACGAGNEDADEVEKLVAVYAKAGARFFDLSAKKEIVKAAYAGLDRVIPKDEQQYYYMCVSVGIKGDPHVSKAYINSEKCAGCGGCNEICPQKAIKQDDGCYYVDSSRCIGCSRCLRRCEFGALEMKSEYRDLLEVLPPLVAEGISSIELHAASEDSEKIMKQWTDVCNSFDGMLGICMDRSHASDVELKRRIELMIANRTPYSTIIQADGVPMSTGADDYATTLQTIATAQIIQRMELPVYILLSGGTNSCSTKLANMCGVAVHGVAVGTFGRELIREYIQKDDFWDDVVLFEKAVKKAKKLVDKCLGDLADA